MVRAHIATLRTVPVGIPPRPPSVRQVTGWLTRHPAALNEQERADLKEVLARCPELDTAVGHIRDFGEILTSRKGARLPEWITLVDTSQLPGLTGFALHLLRDLDAVTAGLTLEWSSGSVEGAVNRIKKIKRQLYGRAGFHLLRKNDPPSVTRPVQGERRGDPVGRRGRYREYPVMALAVWQEPDSARGSE